MTDKLSTQLKTYLENSEIEPDFGSEELKSETIRNLKLDYLEFAKMFIKLFNEFRKHFKDFKFSAEFMEGYEKVAHHSLHLNNLLVEYNRDIEFGKARLRTSIENYVGTNYYEILDFFDLCVEVYSDG